MTVGIAIVIALAVLFGFGIVLSRRASERKKEAIADLQREKEALAPVSLRSLAEDEARDLGLPDMPGADGIPPVVLLKVWKEAALIRERCASPDDLRFVLADGVEPENAVEPDVRLDCSGPMRSGSEDTDAGS
ncbi:MAG: hypothetical protein KDB69_01380, partial [Acidimicrobiia bacterium]|nr:hypothetical protein [Acidimicrobiia bacterium]